MGGPAAGKISRKRRKESGSGSGSSSLEAGTTAGPRTKGQQQQQQQQQHEQSGFADYAAAGEFEIWGEEHQYRLANGLEPLKCEAGVGEGGLGLEQRERQLGQGGSSLRPLLHVTHCELHSPRDAELLRLDQLDGYEHSKGQDASGSERDSYAMMDNYHNPVPPPLPRRHVRWVIACANIFFSSFCSLLTCLGVRCNRPRILSRRENRTAGPKGHSSRAFST